jgi:glucokinase
MILAGDIGGTNTRLALFQEGKMVGKEKKFSSKSYKSLEEIIQEFLGSRKVEKACFGIAGAVYQGKCKATNLAWVVDAENIKRVHHIRSVHLLNDLVANTYGIRVLQKQDLYLLHQGVKQEGNQGLISAGTGLGEAGLLFDGQKHIPFASEGGHTDFAPRDELEVELFLYLKKKFTHVSYERVLSGPGLYNLFQFLIDTGKETCSAELKAEMEKSDPSRVISSWGLQNKDRACSRALDWFISLYGAEAGNVALKFLSFGGIYLGGGIAPHLVERMKNGIFYDSFVNKGRFKPLLESIPIWVILNDDAALLGAAFYAEGQ